MSRCCGTMAIQKGLRGSGVLLDHLKVLEPMHSARMQR